MKEHFGKLREIMDKYEESCESHLSELLRKQDEKIKNIQDGILNEQDKLPWMMDDVSPSTLMLGVVNIRNYHHVNRPAA